MNGTAQWLCFLRNVGGGSFLYTWRGAFVPDCSVSSHYVVPDIPCMRFSYFFTTSLLLPLLISCLCSAVGHILLSISVLGGESSAESCNSRRLSCLEVTRGSGENGNHVWCNVGATQPIGIFLPPPSCKSAQLYGLDIFNSFCYCPWNGSPPFPLSSPLWFPLLFGRMVCQHMMCRVKIWGKELSLTQFERNAIFRNRRTSRGFSPGYPSLLQPRLLSHRPLLCYHPPTQLSSYQSFLLFPLILLVPATSH